MKRIEIFDGIELHTTVLDSRLGGKTMCVMSGCDGGGNSAKIPFDENLLSRHLMFLGSIGTGKTNAISQIIAQLRDNLSDEDIMIIFDSKGDFYNEFYRHGKDVVISNDTKAMGLDGKEDYWNLINEIHLDDNMEDNIVEISKTLFSDKLQKTQQPFFPNAAKDLFSAVLFHCCRNAEEMQANNADLREYFDNATIKGFKELLSLYSDLSAMASYIDEKAANQSLGVLSELQQLIREIFIGNFKKAGTLSMRQLVKAKGGRIIFIEYDLGIGSMLSPIYRLLFDLAIKEALCRTKTEGNVYFICDEFKLVPNLQHVDDAVNFGRSLGVKFLIGIQNVEQIYDAYAGKDGKGDGKLAKSLLSGFSTTVCFRVNDSESRKFIQDLYGKNRKKEIFTASVATKGLIEQVRDANVVEDWDISLLEIGQAIIGIPGKEPFLFKFNKAYV